MKDSSALTMRDAEWEEKKRRRAAGGYVMYGFPGGYPSGYGTLSQDQFGIQLPEGSSDSDPEGGEGSGDGGGGDSGAS